MGAQVIGIIPDQITAASAVPEFRVGTIGGWDDPVGGYKEYIYGRAAGTIANRGSVVVETNTNGVFDAITTANTAGGQNGHGSRVAAAQAAMSTNQYGWFQIYGRGPVRTAAAVAVGTRLNTTSTAGAIDDDGTAGARVVNGLVLKTASSAAETNENGVFTYPAVGVTL